MFGSLKKRLKETLKKVAALKSVQKKEPAEPAPEEKKHPKQRPVVRAKPDKRLKQKPMVVEAQQPTVLEPVPELKKEHVPEPEKKSKGKGFFGIVKKIQEKTLTADETEAILKDLQIGLLENDVALEVAEKITDDVKQALIGTTVKRGNTEHQVSEALKTSISGIMKQDTPRIEELVEAKNDPFVILFLGFNGSGKTTTIAKLANRYRKYRPVVAAADTFRAASIEQLEEHSKKVGFKLVKHTYGADPAAVIFDAVKHAKASGSRLVLADTAGRSHSNVNLMDELKKIVRVNKPDMKILVMDSLTGNDIFDQSTLFNDAVGVDTIILTKADVYDKGGACLSAAYPIRKPVIFLGTGQNYGDLVPFNPEDIVRSILE